MNVPLSGGSEPKVLHSGKEIASYVGLGVRTVQRYEKHLGLPIRRFAGADRSSVSAFPRELDCWMLTAGTQPVGRAEWESAMKAIEELRKDVEQLREITELNRKANADRSVNGQSRKPSMENRSGLSSAS